MNKMILPTTGLLGIAFFITVFGQDTKQNSGYKSAHTCKECHGQEKLGNQSSIWKNSGHSRSFYAIIPEDTLAFMKEQEIKETIANNQTCLKCHVPLYEKAPEIMKEGVTCEACHDPAKKHEEIKAWCVTCHEMAHGKSFDFISYWDKIKHPLKSEGEEK